MSTLSAVVLAAGRSRRLLSRRSKVLHSIAGRPLIHYPVKAAVELGAKQVCVIASPQDQPEIQSYLEEQFAATRITVRVQDPPLGTGDAARVGLSGLELRADSRVLILCGDTPLVTAEALRPLVHHPREQELRLATCRVEDPQGYGRIVRDQHGQVQRIVEQKDLVDDTQARICEVNAGIYCASAGTLQQALTGLSADNQQKEYYLTDIVPFFSQRSQLTASLVEPEVMAGVNDRAQLADARELMRQRIIARHRRLGVSIAPTVWIDDGVQLEADVEILDGVHLRGETYVGEGAYIDVGCVLTNVRIGRETLLRPYTVATDSTIGEASQLGPFSHLRAGSDLGPEVHLGNFVETKATRLHRGAKANHLAYLGNGVVGEATNVGAGTIFCNYDGFSKHQTTLGKNVFIGSDSQLVAPVSVGDGAFVATATCVTRDVPAGALAVGRARQENKEGYAERLRARLEARKREAHKPAKDE